MTNQSLFREAWGKFPTGVSVITTVQKNGEVHGMAANGITSVSLEPPLVLVCIGHQRNSYKIVQQTKRFCINILNEFQQNLAEYYSRPHDQRRDDISPNFWFSSNGAAMLENSIASMDCHLITEHVSGDHSIFVGTVDEIKIGNGDPLIYHNGKYTTLPKNQDER